MTLQKAQKHYNPMSRRLGLVLGKFPAYFEPIIEGFKTSNPRNMRGTNFWEFGEKKLPLGGNTLGFVLGRERTLEKEEDNGGEEGTFNAKFVLSFIFHFSFF